MEKSNQFFFFITPNIKQTNNFRGNKYVDGQADATYFL